MRERNVLSADRQGYEAMEAAVREGCSRLRGLPAEDRHDLLVLAALMKVAAKLAAEAPSGVRVSVPLARSERRLLRLCAAGSGFVQAGR